MVHSLDKVVNIMYIDVHMTMTVNITDFRKNIFKYADLVENGYEIEVERAGRKMFKANKIVDDSTTKAKELVRILKKYKGKFPNWNIDIEKMRCNPAEDEYNKRFAAWRGEK